MRLERGRFVGMFEETKSESNCFRLSVVRHERRHRRSTDSPTQTERATARCDREAQLQKPVNPNARAP